MDSISRECMRNNIEMYKYRNAVTIPPLGMIDDLAAIGKCGPQSVILNAIINAKINMKKLNFNQTKCGKLHISKETRNVKCVFLEVQDEEMMAGDQEKYIGDFISSNGSNVANIPRRRSIGMGAVSQIFTLLNEVSLGNSYVEIGLILRESTLLSKMLLSSESWHKLFQYQIAKLEEVDLTFLRKLLSSHFFLRNKKSGEKKPSNFSKCYET